MRNFTNPLDNIQIASPCSANWNEMYGDSQKRFCGDCKLNVYNLSEMSKGEAENFLLNSEGHLCVRFYRRQDGTILTKDCPVGWQAIKRRVSKIAAAVFSMIVGIFGGIFAFNQTKSSVVDRHEVGTIAVSPTTEKEISNVNVYKEPDTNYVMGNVAPVTMGTPMPLDNAKKFANK